MHTFMNEWIRQNKWFVWTQKCNHMKMCNKMKNVNPEIPLCSDAPFKQFLFSFYSILLHFYRHLYWHQIQSTRRFTIFIFIIFFSLLFWLLILFMTLTHAVECVREHVNWTRFDNTIHRFMCHNCSRVYMCISREGKIAMNWSYSNDLPLGERFYCGI